MPIYKIIIRFLFMSACGVILLFNSLTAQEYTYNFENETQELDEFIPKTLVAKFKNQGCVGASAPFELIPPFVSNKLQIENATRKFPFSIAPERMQDPMGNQLADITLIYDIKYAGNVPEREAAALLFSSDLFEYVELQYIAKPMYAINDPYANTNQWHLRRIKAFEAWDHNRGDTNVVIGITDTGMSLSHPDLIETIKNNYADPIDGIDNDGDGYIDNFKGWDMVGNDNDVNSYNNPSNMVTHGTAVVTLTSAEVNNNYGAAGTGFNCRFLPIKVTSEDGTQVSKGYEGIVYAADHGASIINCSWGSKTPTNCGRDVIRYATFNRNSLVIASAGNDSNTVAYYPAAYEYVLSIMSVDSLDKRRNQTWGPTIDLSAPGVTVNGTAVYQGNVMFSPPYLNGSSFAAPIASGVAGLVKSKFPFLTALQIGEQLKATTDFIDNISPNIPNQMGSGRLNAFKAVTDSTKSSVVMSNIKITDNNGDLMAPGSTIYISGDFTNYLFPSAALSATITTTSPLISIPNGSASLGALNMLATVNNNSNPFQITVNNPNFINQPVDILLTITDGNSTSKQWITFTLRRDYVNVAVNDVTLTLSSLGRIGYSQNYQIMGEGFSLSGGKSMLYSGGLMVGTSATQVSDGLYSDTLISNSESDFALMNLISRQPNTVSDFDVFGKFNDNGNITNPMNISISQSAHAWTSSADRKYVIVRYKVINTGTSTLSNLFAGIFTDWTINDSLYCLKYDKADADATCRMGYTYGPNKYAAVKVLSAGTFNHHAIDKTIDGGGGIVITDGFTSAEKFTSLSVPRANAGGQNGNAVAQVVSVGPVNILQGDTLDFSVALIAGNSLADIQASCIAAQTKYNLITGPVSASISEIQKPDVRIFPNPATSEINIQLINSDNSDRINICLRNILGQELINKTLPTQKSGDGIHTINISGFEPGIYFMDVSGNGIQFTRKLFITN